MLISELKTENNEYKGGNTIDIKQYVSYIEKKLLCIDILESCLITDENGLLSCDYFTKKLITDLKLVANYTDLEFTDEFIEDYDFLCEHGILDYIIKNIPDSELNFIDEMVGCELNQRIKISNSLESIVAKGMNKLIGKIPTDKELKSLSKSLIKDINKMNWDKVPILKEMWLTANGKSGSDLIGK